MRQAPDAYQVAVPSHRRAALFEQSTLKLLTERGVDPARVTVYLDAGDPDEHLYRKLDVDVAVSPVRGINPQRVIISRDYQPGTPVVTLDDDVTDVVQAVDPKTLRPVTDLDRFFRDTFDQTAAEDLYAWGVNAVANPFFMQAAPSTNLKFLIGSLWGYFSRPGHPVHDCTVNVKEDYEASLRAWWYDGGALRINDVAVKADHYRAAGGCQDYRDAAASEEAAAVLESQWPGLVRRNTKRRSGHAEVLLARKARTAGHPLTAPPPGLASTHR